MHELRRVLTARDIMTTRLVTLTEDLPIEKAIRLLLKNAISGAPVVDAAGNLTGMLSELDCLRIVSSDEFHGDDQEVFGVVAHFMTKSPKTIAPDLGVYRISHLFMTEAIRRLPVVEEGRLLGQVSRRDVLKAIDEMNKRRLARRRYPDYREPA